MSVAYLKRNEQSDELPKRFVAIDGEGKNTSDGKHIYTFLASSTGDCVRNRRGLSSSTCFDFLLSQKAHGIVVGFSINYDVNMMLRDVPLPQLRRLWSDGHCIWHEYRLSWRPSKVFQITRIHGTQKTSVTVWDMFGFFGKSFVKSLREWKICDEDTANRIEAMKDQRGDFATVDDSAIEAYCFDECRLLAELAHRVDNTFIRAGIRLARYDGAGAAASALLRKHRIK